MAAAASVGGVVPRLGLGFVLVFVFVLGSVFVFVLGSVYVFVLGLGSGLPSVGSRSLK